MKILFVRHGSTEANERGLLLGCGSDPALSEAGRAQAAALANALAGRGPFGVVSSPLLRCRETATAIASAGGVDVALEDRLIEIDYGEWEALPLTDIPPDASERWRHDPGFRPPGGESLDEVAQRVGGWCAEQTGPGLLVAVTHVSPVKAAVAWVLGAPATVAWRLFVGVASITTIDVAPGRAVLMGFNEAAHLTPA